MKNISTQESPGKLKRISGFVRKYKKPTPKKSEITGKDIVRRANELAKRLSSRWSDKGNLLPRTINVATSNIRWLIGQQQNPEDMRTALVRVAHTELLLTQNKGRLTVPEMRNIMNTRISGKICLPKDCLRDHCRNSRARNPR